jgi:hypothetical protein
VDTIAGEGVPKEPPVGVHSIENRWRVRVGAGGGNELAVVRIEIREFGIRWKLYKASEVAGIGGYVDFITLFRIVAVVVNPFNEDMTRALFIPGKITLILGKNMVLIVKHDSVFFYDSEEPLRTLNLTVFGCLGAVVASVRG